MQVVPIFAGGLDFSLPVRKFFYDPLGSGRAFVQCVVSLTGFALVGGPARQDAPKAVTALKKLNVPYLVSLPLVFQTTEEWLESELGVHPVQVALQVCSFCQSSYRIAYFCPDGTAVWKSLLFPAVKQMKRLGLSLNSIPRR